MNPGQNETQSVSPRKSYRERAQESIGGKYWREELEAKLTRKEQ